MSPGWRSHHTIALPRIVVDGHRAHSETYADCHLILPASDSFGERDILHGVRYLDVFERRGNGRWLIADRRVVYDWAFYIDASEKFDLPEAATLGREDRDDLSYHHMDLYRRGE